MDPKFPNPSIPSQPTPEKTEELKPVGGVKHPEKQIVILTPEQEVAKEEMLTKLSHWDVDAFYKFKDEFNLPDEVIRLPEIQEVATKLMVSCLLGKKMNIGSAFDIKEEFNLSEEQYEKYLPDEIKEKLQRYNLEGKLNRDSLIEKQLSIEQIEGVMKKVQDINKYGTAVRNLSSEDVLERKESLYGILTNGFLGTAEWGSYDKGEKTARQLYIEWSKEKKLRLIYFNIIGRGIKSFDSDGTYPASRLNDGDNLTIIFSIDNLEETFGNTFDDREKLKPGQFMMDTKANSSIRLNDRGDTEANPEYGFIASNRVPPEKFRGVVFGNKYYKDDSGRSLERIEEDSIIYNAKNMSEIMKEKFINSKKEEFLLPIYDSDGNLLWPKQMSYEEVKKFVEKRDSKKEENSKE